MADRTALEALSASSPLLINLIGVAGIIAWHLIPRRRANTRLIVQIAFFAAMSAVLAGGNFTPIGSELPESRNAAWLLVTSGRLLWWIHLAWAIIGFVRIYLVLEGRPHEARLLQ